MSEEVQEADPESSSEPGSFAGFRVLVVEDSGAVREGLVRMLGGLAGVDIVGEARGARDAIEQATVLRPDLLTLDLELADGSGFAVLRAVLALPTPPAVAIVTNHASPPVRRRSLSAGANYFFDKSLEFEALVDLVAALAAARV